MKISWREIEEETQTLLQDLLRIDTTNPPGNELQAAEYLAEKGRGEGLECTIHKTGEGRGNLIVHLPGPQDQPPLLLLSHLDVVPAKAEDWQYPPFDGVLKEGWIWGRGALDTKHLTAMQMMAMLTLKRRGKPLNREVFLLATADEERGSKEGLLSLLKEKGDNMFQKARVISEGGGFPVLIGDKAFYLCEIGQKGSCRIRFTEKEKEKQSPFFPDPSGFREAAQLIEKLQDYRWGETIPQTTRHCLEELARACNLPHSLSVPAMIEGIRPHAPAIVSSILQAISANTMTVTVWKGGKKVPLEILVDCRILPDVKKEEVEEHLRAITKGFSIDWDIESFSQGYENKGEDPFSTVMEQALQDEDGEAQLLPYLSPGGSDGRHLQGTGAMVYGFSPVTTDLTFDKVLSMVHGVDERISTRSLAFGTRVLVRGVLAYCSHD